MFSLEVFRESFSLYFLTNMLEFFPIEVISERSLLQLSFFRLHELVSLCNFTYKQHLKRGPEKKDNAFGGGCHCITHFLISRKRKRTNYAFTSVRYISSS